jgi:uncharacterized protein (DUF2147 family)
MKKTSIVIIALFFVTFFYGQNQSVIGKWKTIDDETGKAKSIVEIYEKSGKIYGKVIEILEEDRKKSLCQDCSGEDKNKPILGITVVKGLSKEGKGYGNGKILDPKNGKLYKCSIVLDGKDKLEVRGFVGISMFGRSQYWYRVKS